MEDLTAPLLEFGARVWSETEEDCDAFEDILVNFGQNVKKVEQVAFQFIDDSFSSLKSVSNALDLVVRLQSTSQDEGQHNLLQKHMSTKIEKIIT